MTNYDKIRKIIESFKAKTQITGILIEPPEHAGTWTRGDGAKYTEFSYIQCSNADDNTALWDFMNTHNITKRLEVSGEFPSCPYRPAIILNNILYVKWDRIITYGSPVRLKNSSVWRSRECQPETEES